MEFSGVWGIRKMAWKTGFSAGFCLEKQDKMQ
jgi:hypothetical protein